MSSPSEAPGNTLVLRRTADTAEGHRLAEDAARTANWKRWGPYLAERQWATVREDYSPAGTCWDYFPHDHARSRAYRWGEDGLLGFCDRECRLCFALALWNERDPILKERLFGLTGPEGNHGEDAKEEWFYLDSTPTHSYAKALYKYLQAEFPYARLIEANRNRGKNEPEFELADTGVFAESRYFDVVAEYAKQTPDDLCIRIQVTNCGPEPARLHVLPTLWFRNTWDWGCPREGCDQKPVIRQADAATLRLSHETLGEYFCEIGPAPDGTPPPVLFTENETNQQRLFGSPNMSPFVKDAFHEFVIRGQREAVNPAKVGTKAAPHYCLTLAPGETQVMRMRLVGGQASSLPGPAVVPTAAASTATSTARMAADPAGRRPALQVPPFTPYDPTRPVSITHRRMPHWSQDGVTYFVTFRLADALPQSKQQELQKLRADWLARHSHRLTPGEQAELNDLVIGWHETQFDECYGSCALSRPDVSAVVERALLHFDGERYALGSYVIMPNHVHVLVRPLMEHTLRDVLHSWKSFTAKQANALLQRKGAFWQEESFDRIVRDERRLEHFAAYIAENPGTAKLSAGLYRFGAGCAAKLDEGGQASSLPGAAVVPTAGASPAASAARMAADPAGRRPALQVSDFDALFAQRRREADEFYAAKLPQQLTSEERRVLRQGYAGLLWSKQFYHYVVSDWLDGDPKTIKPPASRLTGRNRDWRHLYARDVISMPDKWEYPWFAAWDVAFHMLPFAGIDGHFAKQQLGLFLREWYMHPNGQLPAYEFGFDDVNPPVHAWAAWRVYKLTGPRGERDRDFLESVFQKLLLNFTWWVNRKDSEGNNLFSGGFLGLDNIGVFDRSKPLPSGGALQQADGTAWMAFYCSTMLAMALELAWDGQRVRPAYEDMASKFLEHFVQIADAMNSLGGSGLWDEADGFYYDQIHLDGRVVALKSRSLVGLLPLIAVEVLERDDVERLAGFSKRLRWFTDNRHDLDRGVALGYSNSRRRLLLSIPTRDRLRRVLRFLGDEAEFLSPFGIRSLSKFHAANPFVLRCDGQENRVDYVPGESNSWLFGGNSNWRGPVWLPVNYLLIEALQRYHHFYGPEFTVEYPAGSGRQRTLEDIAGDLEIRLTSLFLPDASGRRPCHGEEDRFQNDPAWRDLVLFHEYFHAESGRGLGANHQTGWTALALRCLESIARRRAGVPPAG